MDTCKFQFVYPVLKLKIKLFWRILIFFTNFIFFFALSFFHFLFEFPYFMFCQICRQYCQNFSSLCPFMLCAPLALACHLWLVEISNRVSLIISHSIIITFRSLFCQTVYSLGRIFWCFDCTVPWIKYPI